MLNISVAVAAISSAAIVLTFNLRSSVRILKRIDWSMLVFFGGLFVLVGGLKNTGVLDMLAINVLHITGGNLAIAITVIFLLSAALSIFIDNVALVAAFIPIIQGLALHGGMELAPLTWALSLGVCFGGLATPFGTATNIAGLSTCSKMNHVICWRTYFRAALPLMALAVLFANAILVLRYAF
jgi:Na+/H+ antiporter NhaD/arsenite permease-like protein